MGPFVEYDEPGCIMMHLQWLCPWSIEKWAGWAWPSFTQENWTSSYASMGGSAREIATEAPFFYLNSAHKHIKNEVPL